MDSLYEKLIGYGKSGMYPFHMPGHKRNSKFFMENPYSFDITEVDGMDDLNHPEGILKEAGRRAAKAYGAVDTKYLVGGSTAGILAAISACTRHGDAILIARNCHKSVYNAVFTLGLRPYYIYPSQMESPNIFLGIKKKEVEAAWKSELKISCVVITSPTYEGMISDIKGISQFLQEKNIPLIVDEAHGAHLKWSDFFPGSALGQGADIVIQSLHKTLPALTQTALLHLGSERIPPQRISRYLSIYQTSSPSYVLMASIDQCIGWLQTEGKDFFHKYYIHCQEFYDRMKSLKYIYLLDFPEKDRSKVVIVTERTKCTGYELAGILRTEYKLETEMAQESYVVVITGAADTEGAFFRLGDALIEIDQRLEAKPSVKPGVMSVSAVPRRLKMHCTPYEADISEGELVCLEEAAGNASKDYIYTYPPGVPFVVPGEVLTPDIIRELVFLQQSGAVLQGLSDLESNKIEIIHW